MDGEVAVPLPFSVNQLINEICVQKLLKPPDVDARKSLSKIGEESAIDVLNRISSTSSRIYNLSGYIVYMVNKYGSCSCSSYAEAESIRLSSSPSSTVCSTPQRGALYDSPTLKEFFESPCFGKSASPVISQNYAPANSSHSGLSCSSLRDAIPAYGPSVSHNVSPHVMQFVASPSSGSNGTNGNQVGQNFSDPPRANHCDSPVQRKLFTPSYEISPQSLLLAELEFRKLFMVHSYIGRNKLEDGISVEEAIQIKSMKSLPMFDFEDWMWRKFGSLNCQLSDRAMYLDWDSGKTHSYTCYVSSYGDYQFKGPYLETKKTHLQRALGDENVLIVNFAETADNDMMTFRNYETIVEAGILVGLRRYRFFVFKDGGKEKKPYGKEDKKRGSSVKCYFVKRESIAPWDDKDTFITNYKTTHDVRCLFMHVHTVPSIVKYNARLSLTLSTTIKSQVDLASVSVEEIDDIPCMDENGYIVCDEDGEPLIQTDGTGFISEDLAVLVQNDFHDAKYIKDKYCEKFDLIQPETVSAGLVTVADPVSFVS